MTDFIANNWPVITVAAAWLARERLNIVALGAWIVNHGGLRGIAVGLIVGTTNIEHRTSNIEHRTTNVQLKEGE